MNGYKLQLQEQDDHDQFEVGHALMIVWVNRREGTIGVERCYRDGTWDSSLSNAIVEKRKKDRTSQKPR
jgi:hypothetical protein